MCIAEQPQICQINWPIHCDKVIMVANEKKRFWHCAFTIWWKSKWMLICGQSGTKTYTHIDDKKCLCYFIDCSLEKRTKSSPSMHIYLCILMCIRMSPKRMMIFFSNMCVCVKEPPEMLGQLWKKLDLCVACEMQNVKKVPSLALFSGWFPVFGSIFKLNYWISSMWSNMHMYSSLFIVVHADFISVCECVCYCGCRM